MRAKTIQDHLNAVTELTQQLEVEKEMMQRALEIIRDLDHRGNRHPSHEIARLALEDTK